MPFTLVYPMLERLTIYFNLTEPVKVLAGGRKDAGKNTSAVSIHANKRESGFHCIVIWLECDWYIPFYLWMLPALAGLAIGNLVQQRE